MLKYLHLNNYHKYWCTTPISRKKKCPIMLAPCTYLPNISLRSFCEVRSVLPFSSFCTIFALFVWGRQPHPPILQISDEHRYFLNHSKHRYISLMNTWWWPMIEIFCVAQSSKISKIADFSLFLSIFVLCFYQVGTSSLWLMLIMTAKRHVSGW